MKKLRVKRDFAEMVDGLETTPAKKMEMRKDFEATFGGGYKHYTAAALYILTLEGIAKNCAMLRDLHGDYQLYLDVIANLLMEDIFEAPEAAGEAVQ